MILAITFWMKHTVQLSSIVGCNLSSFSGWKVYEGTIIRCWMILAITFWMKLIQFNYPLLDVAYHHFLDEKYVKKWSSLTGWFLPSLSGWNLFSTIIIHYWMLGHINLIVSFSSPPASVSTYRFYLHYCLETPATPLSCQLFGRFQETTPSKCHNIEQWIMSNDRPPA